MDHKVRKSCLAKEGQIFKRGYGEGPGTKPNCRCIYEHITMNLEIHEHEIKFLAFADFIRYGGGSSIVLE